MLHARIAARLPGPHPDVIARTVAAHLSVPLESLVKKDRTPEMVYARHMAMYLCRKYGGHKLVVVAKYFQRDHTTVVHAEQTVTGWLTVGDQRANRDLSTLLQALVNS